MISQAKAKLQTLKGFRDFLPEEAMKRQWLENKIREIFELWGYDPIQTPTLEYADVILGKYGEEADKLVYTFKDRGGRKVALPYDLTVPASRILGQYTSRLTKPFRRYQIQNVFRADKPQKGRFREFIQCDIDIFGSTSPQSDAEIIACAYFTYKNIGFDDPKLVINDRKVLFDSLSQYETKNVSVFSIIQSIDKLDKLSEKEVISELAKKGLAKSKAKKVLESIKNAQPTESLEKILKMLEKYGVPSDSIFFNPFIARGLDYYTGMIFEVQIPGFAAGSVGGGGRYDKLIKELSGVDIPAVGMALGFDRTLAAAEQSELVPQFNTVTKVLVTIFDKNLLLQSTKVAALLRESGINTEVYPDENTRLDKQLKYANKKGIPFVVIIGPEEAKTKKALLKNMLSGKQKELDLDNLALIISNSQK